MFAVVGLLLTWLVLDARLGPTVPPPPPPRPRARLSRRAPPPPPELPSTRNVFEFVTEPRRSRRRPRRSWRPRLPARRGTVSVAGARVCGWSASCVAAAR